MRVKLWEIADPLVSESEPNQPHDSHIRLLQAIDDFTSQSGTSQMSRSLPPATNGNGELSCTARQAIDLEISDLLSPKKPPSSLCQSLRHRQSACVRLGGIADPLISESQPNHSRITATSHPDHTRITAESPSESQPHHRVTTESRPHDSRITATRQLTYSRISVSGTLPINLLQGLRNRRSTCFKL